jgi:acylphosphatase
MKVRRRWFVHGRVQGVWFRESTRRRALEIGNITGWVRNLPDGQVEVLAEGPPERLVALEAFLGEGPAAAQVHRVVEVPPESTDPLDGFRVGP